MNILNALAFAAFGSIMEFVPRAFPGWFPPTNSDQASCRALWLGLMGAVQIALGAGFIVRAHLVPVLIRILSIVPSAEPGTLALATPRAVTGR
jgi:hypothetical protein